MNHHAENPATIIAPLRLPHVLVLVLILAAGVTVRLYGINQHSMRYDEMASVACSTGRGLWHETIEPGALMTPAPRPTWFDGDLPRAPVWFSLDREQHPPLYFMTLGAWRSLADSSDTALRLLSVLFAAVMVLFIFDAARLWFGVAVALWAAALCAIATPMIEQSLQVRGYVPMVACMTGALAAAARIDIAGITRLRLAALAGGVLAAMLTHYFAIGACGALLVYAIIAMRGRARMQTIAALAAAAVVYAVVWGPFLLRQRANFALNREYLTENSPHPVRSGLQRTALMPARFFNEVKPRSTILAMGFAAIYVVPFLLVRRRRAMLLLGLWLALPVAMVLLLDVSRHTQQLTLVRYVLVAAPAAYLAVPAIGALATRRRLLAAVLPGAMFLSCLLSMAVGEPFNANQSDPGDYRALASAFSGSVRDRCAVVFIGQSRGDWYGGWLYLAFSHYANRWPQSAVVLVAPPSPRLAAQLQKFDTVLLVTGPGFEANTWFPGFASRVVSTEPYVGTVLELKPAVSEPAEAR